MRFAHLSDCHLGGWRQPELQELNLESFRIAIKTCIEEKTEFILFSGDLFDSAFPPIEILKETFSEFRKLKEAGIKCYVIAGSHDYSVSGKTFLDVLEKGGFCEICAYEEKGEPVKEIILKPCIHQSYYIYGYPGKKSGLEIPDLRKIKINEPYQSNFRILMLHTTIDEVKGDLPIDSINLTTLPPADYYALGHIHINFEEEINNKPAIYSGPLFPNNFKELEELKNGSFYIIDVEGYTKVTKKEIKLKEIVSVNIEITDAITGTAKILSELEKRDLKDKILLLRIYGELEKGKTSDIKFSEIEEYLNKQQVYSFLKNTSKLETQRQEFQSQINPSEMGKVEETLVQNYKKENPSDFNRLIFELMDCLNLEKQEGEKSTIFEQRLFLGLSKLLKVEL
ncbi:MAG: exonuclease SbcCD subunit D [Candidatus Nanoarchaeia archaeon]|nr:exonuclease SbcCD subunit D [Candidatus Nanoarchaeia archaeon]MDD5741264.1 exonuclease SbcCD subunit D [Candidatus Nanoarchaeia archaeon]